MAGKYTLQKKERLKSRKQIDLLFKKGKRFVVPPFRIFYIVNNDQPGPLQMGVAAGTKNFKRSVDRNRIKRLIREAWRLQKNELAHSLLMQKRQLNVFIVYTGKELPVYADVFAAVTISIQKIKEQIS